MEICSSETSVNFSELHRVICQKIELLCVCLYIYIYIYIYICFKLLSVCDFQERHFFNWLVFEGIRNLLQKQKF
jgi:hypothetical protein